VHVHADAASTDSVHAPNCGLHAICVAVVIVYRPLFQSLNASKRRSMPVRNS
jgi:hypothetical protein